MSLQNALDYAKINPNGSYANELRKRIESGKYDSQAMQEGVELPFRPLTKANNQAPVAMTKGETMKAEANKLAEEGSNIKGTVKAVGASVQLAWEKALSGYGDLANIIGVYTSGADLSPEQRLNILEQLEIEKNSEEEKKKLSDAGEKLALASTFAIPAGTFGRVGKVKNILAKAGIAGIAGAEGTTMFKVATEGELPTKGELATGTIVGAALPIAGAGLKNIGKKVFKSAIPATAKEAEFLQKSDAGMSKIKPVTRADTAFEKGLVGTKTQLGTQSVKEASKLKETIYPILKASKEKISKKELFQPIKDFIKAEVEPGRKKELEKALAKLTDEYKGIKDLSLPEAQEIKISLAKFTPKKAFKGEDIAAAYKELKNQMAKGIIQSTYNKLSDANIKKQYLDWANLIQLEDLGIKARQKEFLAGGLGNLWNSAVTPTKTIAGRTIYNVGEILSFEAPTSFGPIRIFSDFLKKQGINTKEELINMFQVKEAVTL